MTKNVKASLVNLTLNMRYKKTNNIKFVITRFVFFQAQNAPKSVLDRGSARTPLGELTTLPRTPNRLGRGYPLPFPFPPSASRTRRLQRLGSQAPSTQNPGYTSAHKGL